MKWQGRPGGTAYELKGKPLAAHKRRRRKKQA